MIVDDEKNIVDIIDFNLKKEGYETLISFDGEDGYNKAIIENPDLILLDIMMPKLDGFEVCKKIRLKSQIPIIMLTARAEELDKVLGLELGADDYVTKPFSIRELMARIKVNIKRSEIVSNDNDNTSSQILTFGDIQIDNNKYEIKRNGHIIDLTRREFDLIKLLASNNGMIFSRESLLEKIWGYEYYGDVRAVDVTIRRLRTKIENEPDNPKYILTKRGIGYYFNTKNN